MAKLRRLNASTLFKCMVVPTMLLCAIFHKPALQWVAFFALLFWFIALLLSTFGGLVERRNRKRMEKKLGQISAAKPEPIKLDPAPMLPENEVFLIRQIHIRITEQLKASYPLVSWIWVKRPSVEEICQGGVWKIRVANTEPFNFGEVEITSKGKIRIVMIQAVSLNDAEVKSSDDLAPEDLLKQVDVKSWYEDTGEAVLSTMIDNLNAQGHRKLLIKEDGEVCITLAGSEQKVDQINDFPPRIVWEEFCRLLAEDDIAATIIPEGLSMAW